MTMTLKAALAASLAFVPAVALAQNVPPAVVAVVDTQRVFSDCTACKAAQTTIQGLVTQAQTQANTLGQPIQTEAQALQTEANRVRGLAAGAARTSAETAFQTRATALQTRQETAQRTLQGLEQNIQSVRANVVRQINERLNPIISQVMTARGANIALDQQATLAAARTVDVTDQVLTQLNAALPSVSVTPLPQQAPATPATPGR